MILPIFSEYQISKQLSNIRKQCFKVGIFVQNVCRSAPSEDRTHDLQIMRLTRCLLRYRGG